LGPLTKILIPTPKSWPWVRSYFLMLRLWFWGYGQGRIWIRFLLGILDFSFFNLDDILLGLLNGIMGYKHLVYSHICNEMQSKVCILGVRGVCKSFGMGLKCEC
jgi:hypothetical protein